MDTIQRGAKNSLVLFVSNSSQAIFNFFFFILLARYLGVDYFGAFSAAIAFTILCGLIPSLGLDTYLIKEIACDKSLGKKYFGNIVTIRLFLLLFTIILFLFIVNLSGYSKRILEVNCILGTVIISRTLNQTSYAIFKAHEKMEYFSFGMILTSSLILFGAVIGVYLRFSIIGLAIMYASSHLITLVFNFLITIWKFYKPILSFNLSFWKLSIKEAFPFFLVDIFMLNFRNQATELIILSYLHDKMATGFYSTVGKFLMALLLIPTILNTTILPIMSRFHRTSTKSLNQTFFIYLKIMIILSIPIGFGITILSSEMILILVGSDYLPSVISLKIAIWAIVFLFLRSPFEMFFISTDRQATVAKVAGLCFTMNIILDFIFIYNYSFQGASFAILISNISYLLIYVVLFGKFNFKILNRDIMTTFVKSVMVSCLMGIFVLFLKEITNNLNILNLSTIIFVSALFYFLTLLIVKGFSSEDIKILKHALKGLLRFNKNNRNKEQ
ncbi:MAG: flippase [Promethearchaeota archaeon]